MSDPIVTIVQKMFGVDRPAEEPKCDHSGLVEALRLRAILDPDAPQDIVVPLSYRPPTTEPAETKCPLCDHSEHGEICSEYPNGFRCRCTATEPASEGNLEMDAGAGASDYSHSLTFTSSKFIVIAFGHDQEHCEDVLQCVLRGRFHDQEGDREYEKVA